MRPAPSVISATTWLAAWSACRSRPPRTSLCRTSGSGFMIGPSCRTTRAPRPIWSRGPNRTLSHFVPVCWPGSRKRHLRVFLKKPEIALISMRSKRNLVQILIIENSVASSTTSTPATATRSTWPSDFTPTTRAIPRGPSWPCGRRCPPRFPALSHWRTAR